MFSTLDEWIARTAITISLDSCESLNLGVDTLMAGLGSGVELLALGEALHGSDELLRVRNRLFQRLVTDHGFTAIAIESSFPRASAVSEYVLGRGAADSGAVQESGFSHGFGRSAANAELVEWIRRCNADPAQACQVHFYGFDSPTEMMSADSPRMLLTAALDYLDRLVGASRSDHRERMERLLGEDAAWENSAAMFDPAQSIGGGPEASALRLATEDLIADLTVRWPELVARGGLAPYLAAARHATLAREMLTYHATVARPSAGRTAKLLGLRDAMMAKNLEFALAHQRALGGGRVLAFAHNMHIKRGAARWQLGADSLEWWPAGAHLHGLLGPRYAAIGTGITASSMDGIAPAEPGTLEARVFSRGEGGRSLRVVPSVGRHAIEPEIAQLSTRSTSGANSTYFPFTAESWMDFDWLAVLDASARGCAA